MSSVSKLQVLGCVAVEMSFPKAGLNRMPDFWMSCNESLLKRLRTAKGKFAAAKRTFTAAEGTYTAGSRAEGLVMEDGWGHGISDQDIMVLHGASLIVHVLPMRQQIPEHINLMHRPEGCPSTYTSIQVLHREKVLRAISREASLSVFIVKRCVVTASDCMWFHSRNLLEAIQGTLTSAISGPAGQEPGGLWESIHTLVCSCAQPDMMTYKARVRKHWPSETLLDILMQ